MSKITKKELVEILKNTTADKIGLTTLTVVKMKKTGNPLVDEQVQKRTSGEFEFGGSYQERLNESFDSSLGTVETKKLPWGHWVEGAEGKVIHHTKTDKKGNTVSEADYLRYYNNIGDIETKTLVNGEDATEEQLKTIEEFSSSKKEKVYTTDKGNEVTTKLQTNVVNFDNIVSITIDDETYEICD